MTATTKSSSTTKTSTPTGLKSTAQTSTSLTFGWNSVSGAPRYRIQLSRSSTMSSATYHRFYGTSGKITGLKSGATYYAKIRTIEDDGTNLSSYSSAVKSATKSASAAAANARSSEPEVVVRGNRVQGGVGAIEQVVHVQGPRLRPRHRHEPVRRRGSRT